MDDSKDSNEREDERYTLVYSGRLFQQLHVVAHIFIKENQLIWVCNQCILRTELYNRLKHVISKGDCRYSKLIIVTIFFFFFCFIIYMY